MFVCVECVVCLYVVGDMFVYVVCLSGVYIVCVYVVCVYVVCLCGVCVHVVCVCM